MTIKLDDFRSSSIVQRLVSNTTIIVTQNDVKLVARDKLKKKTKTLSADFLHMYTVFMFVRKDYLSNITSSLALLSCH